jgi:hypothetical protein
LYDQFCNLLRILQLIKIKHKLNTSEQPYIVTHLRLHISHSNSLTALAALAVLGDAIRSIGGGKQALPTLTTSELREMYLLRNSLQFSWKMSPDVYFKVLDDG